MNWRVHDKSFIHGATYNIRRNSESLVVARVRAPRIMAQLGLGQCFARFDG